MHCAQLCILTTNVVDARRNSDIIGITYYKSLPTHVHWFCLAGGFRSLLFGQTWDVSLRVSYISGLKPPAALRKTPARSNADRKQKNSKRSWTSRSTVRSKSLKHIFWIPPSASTVSPLNPKVCEGTTYGTHHWWSIVRSHFHSWGRPFISRSSVWRNAWRCCRSQWNDVNRRALDGFGENRFPATTVWL